MPVENKTTHYQLALPHRSNPLDIDVDRLVSAITRADAVIHDLDAAMKAEDQAIHAKFDSKDAVQIAALQAHKGATTAHTKAQVGLGNVDNTSDVDKPVSTAMQQELNRKIDIGARLVETPTAGTTSTTLIRDSHGRLTRVDFELDGKSGQTTFDRDAQGNLSATVTTYDGRKRTETLHRHAHGHLLSVTATEENA